MRNRLHDSEDWCGDPPAVPTSTLSALGLMFVHDALSVNYIELAPVSDISVSYGGSFVGGRSVGAILGSGITTLGDAARITRGGLQIGLERLKDFAATP